MASSDLTMDVIFLTQTEVGILENFSLLCRYIILPFTGYRLRSTDFILKHLIVANFLVLISKGVPQTVIPPLGGNIYPVILDADFFSFFTEWGGSVHW